MPTECAMLSQQFKCGGSQQAFRYHRELSEGLSRNGQKGLGQSSGLQRSLVSLGALEQTDLGTMAEERQLQNQGPGKLKIMWAAVLGMGQDLATQTEATEGLSKKEGPNEEA